MEPLNEHFLKVHEIFSKFQTEIEWNEKKQIRGCFSIEVIPKYSYKQKHAFLDKEMYLYVLYVLNQLMMYCMDDETQKVSSEMCQSNINFEAFLL